MLKSLYDTDCTVWSPQGKLFQINYAMEAVKQGSVCLALRSNNFAVLCSLKRSPFQLAQYYDKIFKIQNNIGMVMAGLIGDARVLCKYMRNQCINYKYAYGTQHPINRLIDKVAISSYSLLESQHKTRIMGKRPYGVGLLVAGYDQDGPHIFETCPSGNFYQYNAYAIGARSQSAKTYFENYLQKIKCSDLDQLIKHGLMALKKCIQQDDEYQILTRFSGKSVQVAFVGKQNKFKQLNLQEINKLIAQLQNFDPKAQMEIIQ